METNTKYGQLPDEILMAYVNGMTGKIFKMLPMKQDGSKTLLVYMESILREFIGNKELVEKFKHNEVFLAILGTLESLLHQDNFSLFRSDILKILNLIEQMKSSLGGDKRE
jgi:hypothetical protein